MRTQRLIAYAFVTGLVSLLAGSAMAASTNVSLKGTYRHNTIISCAQAPGFTPPPEFLPIEGGNSNNIYWTGLLTYDGKGNATATEGHGILILPGPYLQDGTTIPAVITFGEETCTWPYTVNRDGSFNHQEGVCTGLTTGGPPGVHGTTYSLTGAMFAGQVAVGGQVLIFNKVEPVQQTLGNGFSVQRICGYIGTAVRVRPE